MNAPLTEGQFAIIDALEDAERDLCPREIADRAGCHQWTVRNNIEGLVENGLVVETREISNTTLYELA